MRTVDPAVKCLKVHEWPAADQRAWQSACRPGTLLRPGKPASMWAATTRQTMIESYGRWLNWLARRDLLDPHGGAAQQLSSENVLAYVDDLRRINAPLTIVNRIRCLYFVCEALAPAADRDWLQCIWKNLQRASIPARDKRSRLVEAQELFAYGLERMADAESNPNRSPFERAVQYRDGLLLALLAARPLRLRNLSMIEIGRHLVKEGSLYWLTFSATETKTKRAIDWPFPDGLRPNLERYLSHYRPLLFPKNRGSKQPMLRNPNECDRLWVSIQGTPMCATTIYARIIALTRSKFGRSINPHLFRDAAATAIATHDPEHVGTIMPVLGHSSPQTSQRHYDQSRTIQAMRTHHRYVEDLLR